jgi:hypothetical protein
MTIIVHDYNVTIDMDKLNADIIELVDFERKFAEVGCIASGQNTHTCRL